MKSFSLDCQAIDIAWSSGGNWLMVGGATIEANYRRFIEMEGDPESGLTQSETNWFLGPYGVENNGLMVIWGVLELCMTASEPRLHYRTHKSASCVLRRENGAWRQVFDAYSRPRLEPILSAPGETEGCVTYFPAVAQKEILAEVQSVPPIVSQYLAALDAGDISKAVSCFSDSIPEVASMAGSHWPTFGLAAIREALTRDRTTHCQTIERSWILGPYGVSHGNLRSIWGVTRQRLKFADGTPEIFLDERHNFSLLEEGENSKLLLAHTSRPRADSEYNNMMLEDPRVVLFDPSRALPGQPTHADIPGTINGLPFTHE